MSTPRLPSSLASLVPGALPVLAGAPWWGVALLILLHPLARNLPEHILALVQARNEARRGRHEDRLLAVISEQQPLEGLSHIRQARQPTSGPPEPPPEPPTPPDG